SSHLRVPRSLRGESDSTHPRCPRARSRMEGTQARAAMCSTSRAQGANERRAPFASTRSMRVVSQHLAHELAGARRYLQLFERALLRSLVRSPTKELRAMTEAIARDMVVSHLDDELRL